MKFIPTAAAGAFIVEQERREDERGWFARTWGVDEFAPLGLETGLAQISASFSKQRGTLRGMHWQAPPHAEVKIVRCVRGAIFDVGVDLRPHSPTFRHWVGVELNESNGRALYLPRGFAHGHLTLADDCEVLYLISTPYSAESSRGARWNDPFYGIRWPEAPRVISDRDRDYPELTAAQLEHLKALP